MIKVSASIVVYNEKKDILKRVIDSFLDLNFDKELIIVDNSPKTTLKEFCSSFNNIKYIFVNKNIGFGAGHNLAFKNFSIQSDIHLIINPDIYFCKNEIDDLIKWFYISSDISLATSQVLNTDDSIQNIVRNIPTPISLIKRKLYIDYDEINIKLNQIIDIPFAHGCFLVFKTEVYKKLNGFDEKYFMYMEDVDIFIRAKKFGRTVINTNYKIYHKYRKGSSKSLKLFFYHLISMCKFFLKYNK